MNSNQRIIWHNPDNFTPRETGWFAAEISGVTYNSVNTTYSSFKSEMRAIAQRVRAAEVIIRERDIEARE